LATGLNHNYFYFSNPFETDELKISSELPCAEESELRQEEFKRSNFFKTYFAQKFIRPKKIFIVELFSLFCFLKD
jgi:hypothetical protein